MVLVPSRILASAAGLATPPSLEKELAKGLLELGRPLLGEGGRQVSGFLYSTQPQLIRVRGHIGLYMAIYGYTWLYTVIQFAVQRATTVPFYRIYKTV